MRASVASLSKKFISTFFAATLAVSLVPTAAFAVDSDAADAADIEAGETNSDTSTEANVNRPDIISTVAVLESNENEVSAPSISPAVLDEPMDDASASVDGGKENGEDVIVDDESSSSILAGGIINQTHPLQVVAQQESTRSYFLAQTLESTRTIPVVSAQLPIDTGNAEQPGEGNPTNGEETNGIDDTGTIVGTVAAASTVVGSFEYRGMTFAIEADGASVALMAVDYSKLPEAFIEKQVIVVPESVTPDGIDYFSVTRIADEAFASLKKGNANPDYVGCEALLSDEELLAEAGIDSTDLGEDDPLAGCTGILALGIPATVTKIEDDAISGFETLQYIVVADGNPEYASFDGALYSADKSQLRLIPEGRVGAVCVASSVAEVDPEVFSHCPSVETLVTDADSADNQLPRGDVSAISRLVETAAVDGGFIEPSLIFELSPNVESAPLALESVSSYAAATYTVTFTGSATIEYTRRFNDGTTSDQVVSTQTLTNGTWSKAAHSIYNSVNNLSVFINDSAATSTYWHFYRIRPTNPGFTCTGWTFAGTAIAAWGDGYPLTKAGAIAPIWTANTITLTWNCNGGNTISANKSVTSLSTTQTYATNAKVALPTTPNPERSLYYFKGWFTAASNGTQVTASTALPTSNTTYYAQWTAITLYDATFKWSGTATAAWTKRYLNSDGSAKQDVVQSTENLTNANKVYKSRYVYSSGTNVSVFSGQYGIDTTGKYEFFWRITPANPGYTCSGWKLGGTAFTNGIGTMKSGTLEPTWSANTITMTWNSNGGSAVTNTSKVYAADAKVVMPTATEWLGRTFDGWFTAASGGTQVTASTALPTSNTTYYAHWTENIYYIAVKAETGASLKSNDNLTVKASALTATLPDVTISAGYAWGNWNLPATTGLALKNGTELSGASVTAVIQKSWTKNTVVGTVTAKATQTLWDVTFKWSGSATCAWTKRYHQADGSNNDIVESTETLTNANKKFTCSNLWSSGTNVSVNSGQSGTDSGGSYYYFWRITPTREGYTCSGWTLNGTAFSGGIGSAMAAGTLEPIWTANSYTITWDAGEGTNGTIAADVSKQTFGNAIKLPPNPTREGYKFEGWYNAPTGGKKIHPDTGDIKTVEADAKIYFAHWSSPVTGTVTLKAPLGASFTQAQVTDYNNATGTHPTVTYVSGSELTITYTVATKSFSLDGLRPSRDGHKFASWTPAVTAPSWNKGTETYTAVTYTAVLDEYDYVITYVDESNKPLVGWMDENGTPSDSVLTFGYNGATTPALPVLKKRGYTWEKWTVKGSEIAITEVPKGSSDITIVAHFTANPYTVKVHLADATESTGWEASYMRTYDDPVLELPATAPKRAGYKFGGFKAYTSEDEGASSVSVIDEATGGSVDTLVPGGSYKVLDLKTGAGAPYDVAILRPVWTERIAVDVPTDVSFGVLADFSDQKLHFQYGKSSYDPTAEKDAYAPLTFTSYTTAPLGIVAIEAESDASGTSKVFGAKANEVSVTLSGDSAGSVAHKVGLGRTLTPSSGADRLAGLDLAAAGSAGTPTTIRFGLDFGDIAFDEIAFNESATIARLHYTVAILKDGATTAGSSVLGAVDEDGKKVVW